LLARREHAAAEVQQKLLERGYQPAVCQQAIAELVADRYLDDERYAASYVRGHAARGQGPRRIRQDMAAVGLLPDTIEAALAEGPDWHELATQTRVRRFGPEAPADWAERSRQMRFLQYRGFSTDHIRSALGSSGAHPDLDDETDL
jgi:regulatory protein